jgi:hypothetical protein
MVENKKSNFDKEFSEAIDRMLAGEEIEPYADMPDDYREAIDFARKLIELKGVPRPSFKAQLKDSLLGKLSEMEQEKAGWKRFWEKLRHLVPQRPLWRAVTASLLVIVVAGGVIWGTGILTAPPPAPSPSRLCLDVEAVPTKTAYATWAKNAYLPGEEAEIEFKFKNVSSERITVTPFPPRIQVMRPRPHEVVRFFSAGSAELNLLPGETVRYTLVWNQQDDNGQQVTPGWYYVDIEGITVTKATAPTMRSEMSFGTITKVLILYPQGAMERTIEVNQPQTVNGITVILKRVELSLEGAKFYAFTTMRLSEEGIQPPLPKMIPIHAQYTVDGVTKDAGLAGERLLDQGTELIWDNLDPVPSDARELTFTITKFGDWESPWEFEIPLQ